MPSDPQPDWVTERLQAIGRRVRAARLDADLTQEALAERAGVGWRTIHRIEYGYTGTSIATLLRIAHELRIPAREIIG